MSRRMLNTACAAERDRSEVNLKKDGLKPRVLNRKTQFLPHQVPAVLATGLAAK